MVISASWKQRQEDHYKVEANLVCLAKVRQPELQNEVQLDIVSFESLWVDCTHACTHVFMHASYMHAWVHLVRIAPDWPGNFILLTFRAAGLLWPVLSSNSESHHHCLRKTTTKCTIYALVKARMKTVSALLKELQPELKKGFFF